MFATIVCDKCGFRRTSIVSKGILYGYLETILLKHLRKYPDHTLRILKTRYKYQLQNDEIVRVWFMDKDLRDNVLASFFFIVFSPIMLLFFGYLMLTGFDDSEKDRESMYLKEMEWINSDKESN